jgi:hypothetical protein
MSGEAHYADGLGVEGARDEAVAELAGMHGAFSFPERLLQQIWLRGDFDSRALRLRDGRALRLRRRGRWNRLAGPDFADAEMEFGEGEAREVRRGAVEVHLRATDWDRHAHASDPAYDAVVLHVVLFPSMREWTAGAGGRRIPILELLPLLERDLEAYAEDAAVEGIAGRPYSQLREALVGVAPETLRGEVARHAGLRWSAKVRLAGSRIARLGWEEACHHAALETLGYRPNRAPMLVVAERWPLAEWRAGRVDPDAIWEELAQAKAWARGGVRPANHPRARLLQYARWVAARPDWPARLVGWGEAGAREADLAAANGARIRERRRALGLAASRKLLAQDICGGALGGSRSDTFACDAVLPLLAARAGCGATDGWELRWRVWTPGDAPAELLKLAREFDVSGGGGEPPGQGDLQGLLGWLATLSPSKGRGT